MSNLYYYFVDLTVRVDDLEHTYFSCNSSADVRLDVVTRRRNIIARR